jgi:hypothetical protein
VSTFIVVRRVRPCRGSLSCIQRWLVLACSLSAKDMLGTLCKSRITCANSTQYSEEVSDLLLNCFCIFRLQHTLQRVSLLRLCRSVWSCSRSILGYSVYQRFSGVTGLQCPGPNDLCRVRSLRELDRNLVEESVALLKRAVLRVRSPHN